ncbi:SLC6A2 isoform 10, partial [Pongo abelii]
VPQHAGLSLGETGLWHYARERAPPGGSEGRQTVPDENETREKESYQLLPDILLNRNPR